MLYDILFIDDDFDADAGTKDWKKNAQKLFLELVRDNLRVTYTTGELGDLNHLGSKDLSCIKYIFCDLHLTGIYEDNPDKLKKIKSKLIGIFNKLDKHIQSKKITVFINSNFQKEDWKDLEDSLTAETNKHYTFTPLNKKNILSDRYRTELLEENLNLHVKSLIINAAIEVEKIFNHRLETGDFSDVISFEDKLKKLKPTITGSNGITKTQLLQQIKLLQQIRNKLAHTENDLKSIKDEGVRKIFWKIISKNQGNQDPIEFKSFANLTKYLEHIEELKGVLDPVQ